MKARKIIAEYDIRKVELGTLEMIKSIEKLGWFKIVDVSDYNIDEHDFMNPCESFIIRIDRANWPESNVAVKNMLDNIFPVSRNVDTKYEF